MKKLVKKTDQIFQKFFQKKLVSGLKKTQPLTYFSQNWFRIFWIFCIKLGVHKHKKN